MTVWAVRYGNYWPAEVVALYDNELAAREHVERQYLQDGDDMLEVLVMPVWSQAPETLP
jgi:hypothetical protein